MSMDQSGADGQLHQLLTNEGHYRTLVEGIKDYAIFMLDCAGNVVSWNKGAERIKGYRANEIVGQHFSCFYPERDKAARKPWKGLEIAISAGCFEEEGWRVRKDGTLIWASVVITALRDDEGLLRGFAKVTRDISERKRAAEAQAAHMRALESAYLDLERHRQDLKRANEDLEAFTYSVSHDLRAPIRQIDGFTQMLMEEFGGGLNDDARHYLTRVQDGARHMGLLVDDLLNLSQIGRQGLLLQACSLGTIVGEIVATLGPELAERDVRVELDHLPTLSCDPGLAKIVFTNLLSNALKYTRDKSPAAIEVSSLIRDGQRVLYVRDNGVGFDLKYADKLFGVFQRLHKEFEGTGIGLATVQRIIHKHGGEIWADAAPNKGATFYFTFGPPPHARSQID